MYQIFTYMYQCHNLITPWLRPCLNLLEIYLCWFEQWMINVFWWNSVLAGVENIEIDMEKQRVYVTSDLPSEQLLETLKKTGKTVSYVGTAWTLPGKVLCVNSSAGWMVYNVRFLWYRCDGLCLDLLQAWLCVNSGTGVMICVWNQVQVWLSVCHLM